MILALAVAAVNANWTEEQFLDAMLNPKNTAGRKVREKRHPKKYVSGRWRKAQARVADRPPIGNRDDARREVL